MELILDVALKWEQKIVFKAMKKAQRECSHQGEVKKANLDTFVSRG